MATILLTGARGFIGSHILTELLGRNCHVVALTSSCVPLKAGATGEPIWVKSNLLEASEQELADVCRTHDVKIVIHAAWYTNHRDYLISAINRDWLYASKRLAAGGLSGGAEHFCGLGTCLDKRLDELDERDTIYARSKSELRAHLENALPGSSCWARVHFVYGPGDREGRFVPYLFRELAEGRPVSPRAGGLRRDYIHVADLAVQIVEATFAGATGAFDVGTGEAPTLSEIALEAGKAMGRPDLVAANGLLAENEPARMVADMKPYESWVGPVRVRALTRGMAEMASQWSDR